MKLSPKSLPRQKAGTHTERERERDVKYQRLNPLGPTKALSLTCDQQRKVPQHCNSEFNKREREREKERKRERKRKKDKERRAKGEKILLIVTNVLVCKIAIVEQYSLLPTASLVRRAVCTVLKLWHLCLLFLVETFADFLLNGTFNEGPSTRDDVAPCNRNTLMTVSIVCLVQ